MSSLAQPGGWRNGGRGRRLADGTNGVSPFASHLIAALHLCHRPAMVRRSSLALLPLLFAAATPARAQTETQHDLQLWEQLNVVVPVASELRVTLEQIARVSDRQGGVYTTEYGALLGWQVAKGVELGFGYRHVGFHNGNTGADENRLRQQVVVTSGRFSGRLRLDERFHPRGDEIGFRIRPMVRYNLPVGPKEEQIALFASHESFILPNSTAWGQRAGYERMRNLVGVAFPITKALKVDVGYLNQYRLPRGGARAQMDHALSVQMTVNLGEIGVVGLHD